MMTDITAESGFLAQINGLGGGVGSEPMQGKTLRAPVCTAARRGEKKERGV